MWSLGDYLNSPEWKYIFAADKKCQTETSGEVPLELDQVYLNKFKAARPQSFFVAAQVDLPKIDWSGPLPKFAELTF